MKYTLNRARLDGIGLLHDVAARILLTARPNQVSGNTGHFHVHEMPISSDCIFFISPVIKSELERYFIRFCVRS
jgi:hypothetical protein